jgi:hypothetical protein
MLTVPYFFDAKLIVCITFPYEPDEGLLQVICLTVWSRIGIDAHHDTEIKLWIAKACKMRVNFVALCTHTHTHTHTQNIPTYIIYVHSGVA